MRKAELIVAGMLGVLSVFLMRKSAELPIGWDPGRGPGGGAYPFWISFALLALSGIIFVRGYIGATPEGSSSERFVAHGAVRILAVVFGSLTAMIAAVHVVGMYFAIPLFLIFYIRFIGRHSWFVTLSISLLTPVVTFIFFEKLMLILLPKGYTERLFYIFY